MYHYETKFSIIFLPNREDSGVFLCIFLVFLCSVVFFKAHFYKYTVTYHSLRNPHELP